MGNCWGAPIVNHSHSAIKPPSPDTSEDSSKQNGSTERNNSKNAENMSKSIVNVFTFEELKSATRNFRADAVLGEGGFGRVFKGWVDQNTYAPSKVGVGMAVAVKKSSPHSRQGFEEWQAEVTILGKLSHPNLIKLLGYCSKDKDYLLVYEYMPKGSLDNHLFRNGAEPLPWGIRLKIAIGAARGLAFLHTSDKQVIYRGVQTSNILLDEEYNAKLSDFGLAMFGPENGDSYVSTAVKGTCGYAAPEYAASGHLSVKCDVYNYGVVLLEMLTGGRALGASFLGNCAKPSMSDKRKIKKIMDPRLEERYPLKGACQAAQLILKCLESNPRNRPSMEEVLENLEQINAIR